MKAKSHGERVTILCEKFSLLQFQKTVDLKVLIGLRNDLFHETLWHDGRPVTGLNFLDH